MRFDDDDDDDAFLVAMNHRRAFELRGVMAPSECKKTIIRMSIVIIHT